MYEPDNCYECSTCISGKAIGTSGLGANSKSRFKKRCLCNLKGPYKGNYFLIHSANRKHLLDFCNVYNIVSLTRFSVFPDVNHLGSWSKAAKPKPSTYLRALCNSTFAPSMNTLTWLQCQTTPSMVCSYIQCCQMARLIVWYRPCQRRDPESLRDPICCTWLPRSRNPAAAST